MSDTGGTALERAIGEAVRVEATRKRLSHKDIQNAAAVEQRSWRRYFVEGSRSIPVNVLERVAAALGMQTSALLSEAERLAAADPLPPGAFAKDDLDLAAYTEE